MRRFASVKGNLMPTPYNSWHKRVEERKASPKKEKENKRKIMSHETRAILYFHLCNIMLSAYGFRFRLFLHFLVAL